MTLESFLKLVELPTKVASVFPFLVGTSYAVYRFRAFDPINFAIMLMAMLALDMATTALNNYMDFRKAVKTHGFNYEEHNAIVKFGLDPKKVVQTIMMLACGSAILGIVLYARTDIIVLLLGMISFFFAAIYTWGPFPISRTPFGEIISGGVMGGIITFISLYIHIHDLGLLSFEYGRGRVSISFDFMEIVGIIILCLPLIAGIANIMLANNICDMEDDFENRRFTLPLVIGKHKALSLFSGLYYGGYLSIVAGVFAGWLPWTCLLVLVTLIPLRRNLQKFRSVQTKAETFITSVQNFIMIAAALFITLCAGIVVSMI